MTVIEIASLISALATSGALIVSLLVWRFSEVNRIEQARRKTLDEIEKHLVALNGVTSGQFQMALEKLCVDREYRVADVKKMLAVVRGQFEATRQEGLGTFRDAEIAEKKRNGTSFSRFLSLKGGSGRPILLLWSLYGGAALAGLVYWAYCELALSILINFWAFYFTLVAIGLRRLYVARMGGERAKPAIEVSALFGALCLSLFTHIQFVRDHTVPDLSKTIEVKVLESPVDGRIIPLTQVFDSSVYKQYSFGGLNRLVNTWNRLDLLPVRASARTNAARDKLDLDMFEAILFNWWQDTYASGWSKDYRIKETLFGIGGSSYGTSTPVNCSRKLDLADMVASRPVEMKNPFWTNKHNELLLFVPVTSRVDYEYKDESRTITFKTFNCKLKLNISVKSLEPFFGASTYEQAMWKEVLVLSRKMYLPPTPDPKIRTFLIDISQNCSSWFRWNEYAKLQEYWGPELAKDLADQFSWVRLRDELLKHYEGRISP